MSFDIMILVQTVVRFFFILMVGYACAKFGWIGGTDTKRFSNLILCVTQPFMIIAAIANKPYRAQDLLEGFAFLGVGLVVHAVLAGLALVCACRFGNMSVRKITEFCIIFANVGFFGLPLIRSALGEKAEFLAAFFVISYNIVVWTYGMFMLGRANSDIKINFKKVLLNFGTVPSAIGILLYLLKGQLPMSAQNHAVTQAFITAFDTLGSACTPISLLVIGALLSKIPFKRVLLDWRVYYASLIRLVVSPLLLFALARLCGLPQQFCMLTAIIAAVPTAANAVMFAESYDLNPDYASAEVGVSTILSTATIPIVCGIVNLFL